MLVSVFIPTKNRRVLLSKALESVLAQTHTELEVLVVDDGSTDDTAEFLRSIGARDPRVRVLRNDQSIGVCRSRNRAIRTAKGSFITGLDDDDELLPNRIQGFLEFWQILESGGEQFSCVYSQDLVRRGGQIKRSEKLGSARFEHLIRRNVIGNQMFVTRERMIEVGCYDEELVAWDDLELYLRLVRKYGPARLLDVATYLFDDEPRPGRRSRRTRDRILLGYHQVLAKNADLSARLKQELLLQVFGDFYGIRPHLPELIEFVSYGFNLRNIVFLLKALGPRRKAR